MSYVEVLRYISLSIYMMNRTDYYYLTNIYICSNYCRTNDSNRPIFSLNNNLLYT